VKKWLIRLLKSLRLYKPAKIIKDYMAHYAPWNLRRRRALIAFYAQFVKEGDLCFDIGAHTGERTRIFRELGAKVICVEPQRTCLRQLYQRFGNDPYVIIVDKAVGAQEGYAELAVCEEAPEISTMSRKWREEGRFSREHEWPHSEQVVVTTLDALIQTYGVPAFCKIDVEGYEEAVLRGLTRPIPVISFEFVKEFLPEAKHCMDYLLSIGPVVFNACINDSTQWLLPTWVTANILYETLLSIDNALLWGDIYARSQVMEPLSPISFS